MLLHGQILLLGSNDNTLECVQAKKTASGSPLAKRWYDSPRQVKNTDPS
jgi:hypothetical protein